MEKKRAKIGKEKKDEIDSLLKFKEQHDGMVETVIKERQKVTDRENLIYQLIGKIGELGGNPEDFSNKFQELKSNPGST